ncbi:MAG: response regulator [Desulfobacterales bacterium]|nr:response regulator [Desulfobacterales bacterium]
MILNNILVVDDRPDNLFVIQEIIDEYLKGCKVFTAESAEKGIETANNNPIDVALIDVQMPVMDGIEMCRRLKSNPKTSIIPVILLTAHGASNSLKTKGFDAGADEFLTKPIDTMELIARIKVMLRIKKTEDILRKERDLLEDRIKERTKELVELNEKLNNEINERKNAEIERIELEKQLYQSQKMEAIGTLAGGIAHDFNNILFPIIGNAEMTMQEVPKDSELYENQQNIIQSAFRAKDLVAQILTFSRKTEEKKQHLNIQPIIKETLKLMRSTIPATIEIKQAITNECLPILANPTQMHQILMNLCTNAYHAMQDKVGVLTVSLNELLLSELDIKPFQGLSPGRYIKLSVSDTGRGIDKEIINRIFEPYFTTKNKEQGSGLGLSVVHGIVASHDGAISVDSEPGRGTIFNVFLPVAENIQDEVENYVDEPNIIGKGHVLIVDDEEMILRILTKMIESLGYQATTSKNGMDALSIFKSNPEQFDLVITDMAMPGMAGLDLAAEMLKIRKNIPIIICTGYNENLNQKTVQLAGIQMILMKPFTKAKLSKIVCEVIKGA